MNNKFSTIQNIILPNKKINYFVITIVILGIISGSIFLTLLNQNDQNSTINQIQSFFSSINDSSINNGLAFKNSLITNIVYISLIWILGMSIIGIFLNIFLIYLKGFLIGFSVSAIIKTYGIKGIIASFIYIFPHQLINVLVIIILGIYSIMFTLNLLSLIWTKKKINIKTMLKRFNIIFLFSLLLTIFSSLSEAFILPAFMKLIINLFVK